MEDHWTTNSTWEGYTFNYTLKWLTQEKQY
jgi:hypothetical protein